MKKPSIKGMKCTEYLGRFKKDKFIQAGHNTYGEEKTEEEKKEERKNSVKMIVAPFLFQKGNKELDPEKERQKMYDEFNEEVNMDYNSLMKKMKKQNKGGSNEY